ncbi:hypothetical protein [Sorangium sp. So ce1024]|uniref:hypothetical protein n=1 Tax=unclassified Sorangium TaxID=2621164 RepID=UPI003F0849F5
MSRAGGGDRISNDALADPARGPRRAIPPELGNEVVLDVEIDGAPVGEATIYVCLFSVV